MAKSTLIILSGLPGVGKSTVAKYLQERRGFLWVRSDVLRKELFSRPRYDESENDKLYAEALRRVAGFLEKQSVVWDARFLKGEYREAARMLAENKGINFFLIYVTCPEDIVKERLGRRAGDASEATFTHYLEQKKHWKEIAEEHVTIDTSRDIASQLPGLV